MKNIKEVQLELNNLKVKQLNDILDLLMWANYQIVFTPKPYGYNHLRYCKEVDKFIFSYRASTHKLVSLKKFKKILKSENK